MEPACRFLRKDLPAAQDKATAGDKFITALCSNNSGDLWLGREKGDAADGDFICHDVQPTDNPLLDGCSKKVKQWKVVRTGFFSNLVGGKTAAL